MIKWDAAKKIAQRARRKMNPHPELQFLMVLEEEDCCTLGAADMLLYDNGSDERRVIILATSDNLNITEESTSWYLDGTSKSAPQLFFQLLVLHAELTDTAGKSWILLTQKDIPIYLEAFEALTSNCPALLPQVVMVKFEQALRSAHSSRYSLELRLMAATSNSARQSSGTSTNLVTRPSMKQSLLILPLLRRRTLLSTPG